MLKNMKVLLFFVLIVIAPITRPAAAYMYQFTLTGVCSIDNDIAWGGIGLDVNQATYVSGVWDEGSRWMEEDYSSYVAFNSQYPINSLTWSIGSYTFTNQDDVYYFSSYWLSPRISWDSEGEIGFYFSAWAWYPYLVLESSGLEWRVYDAIYSVDVHYGTWQALEFVSLPPMPGAAPAVPEPATMLLLGSGLVGLAVIGRKRFKI